MWGESERASADAMLVCQELHPLPAHPARQKSGSSPDEAMIGFGQAGRQGYASFDHTTALRCMVPYQPILVHQSIIHVRVIFFSSSSSSVLLVAVHETFEILLCAYYSDRER
jgi:hypothetical protein